MYTHIFPLDQTIRAWLKEEGEMCTAADGLPFGVDDVLRASRAAGFELISDGRFTWVHRGKESVFLIEEDAGDKGYVALKYPETEGVVQMAMELARETGPLYLHPEDGSDILIVSSNGVTELFRSMLDSTRFFLESRGLLIKV